MAASRPTDEHAPLTDAAPHPRRSRRGLIAGAAALAAGLLAARAGESVAAAYALQGDATNAAGATTTISGALAAGPILRVANNSALTDAAGDAIQGYAANTNGGTLVNAGIFGRNNDPNGVGVRGNAPNGQAVVGETAGGVALSGTATTGDGVYGSSTSGTGVYGTSSNLYGVFGVAGAGAGAGGVIGYTNTANGVALGGSAASPGLYAGYFTGAVTVSGNFAVTGTKSAAVKHPDGSHRLLYCVEAPESFFVEFGDGKLVAGKAEIALDVDFAALVETAAYRVLATAEGDCNGLFVAARTPTGFTVQEAKGGASAVAFTYCVIARRKDVPPDRLAKTEIPKLADLPKGFKLPGA